MRKFFAFCLFTYLFMAVREKFIWGPDLSDHGPDKHLDFNVEAVS